MVSAFTGLELSGYQQNLLPKNRLIKIEQLMGNTVVSPVNCSIFLKKVAF